MLAENLLRHLELMRDEEWQRIRGVSDAEYLWEPAPDMWSVVPAGKERVATSGLGEWRLEFPGTDPDPAPLTSIAWRVTHMYLQNWMYHSVTFPAGETLSFADFPVAGSARQGAEYWLDSVEHWIYSFRQLHDQDLHRSVTMPWDETWTVGEWTISFLFHNTHHCAEVGAMRDVYRNLGGSVHDYRRS